MKKKTWYVLWGCLFIICAGLGFIPEPAPALQGLMTTLSVLFFLPPALLVWQAAAEKDRNTLCLVRNFSILSLGVTLAALVLNLLSAMQSEGMGKFLHYVLIVVSSPMICSGYWVLSLFLWACLLMVTGKLLGKR